MEHAMMLTKNRFLVAAVALAGFVLVAPMQANAHGRGYYDHCDEQGYCAADRAYRYSDTRTEAKRSDRNRALNETEREELERYRRQAYRNDDRPGYRRGCHHGW